MWKHHTKMLTDSLMLKDSLMLPLLSLFLNFFLEGNKELKDKATLQMWYHG